MVEDEDEGNACTFDIAHVAESDKPCSFHCNRIKILQYFDSIAVTISLGLIHLVLQ